MSSTEKNNLIESEVDFLRKIMDAYEKVTELSHSELMQAKATIDAHEMVAKLSRDELLKAKKEIEELKNREIILRQEIINILNDTISTEEVIFDRIDKLSQTKDKGFFSDLFQIIASLEIDEEEAEFYWREITLHSQKLNEKLGRKIGFRVAMLDYFMHTRRMVKNPKIIEFDTFEEVIRNSVIDDLTGIYNRRFFNLTLQRELKRSKRYAKPFCLFLFDVDNFKLYNDSFGHAEGDLTLSKIAKVMAQSFRTEDTICRTGGEEFGVILPETTKNSTQVAAVRFAEALKVMSNKELKREITISGGIASFPEDGQSPEEIYIRADELAYVAKKTGKNQIFFN
ncbi:MAG: GGDEF domain-containing protein [Leptospiraceae bacterium]|nr:GGDEF domain-containing protein [Leptospiraceae bacterium]